MTTSFTSLRIAAWEDLQYHIKKAEKYGWSMGNDLMDDEDIFFHPETNEAYGLSHFKEWLTDKEAPKNQPDKIVEDDTKKISAIEKAGFWSRLKYLFSGSIKHMNYEEK